MISRGTKEMGNAGYRGNKGKALLAFISFISAFPVTCIYQSPYLKGIWMKLDG